MRIPVFLASLVIAVSSLAAPAFAAICGGAEGVACAADEYCKFPEGSTCGRDGASGFCQKRPEICTKEFMPVCGCDGMFYSNRCMAHMGGTDVDFEGFCKDKPMQ